MGVAVAGSKWGGLVTRASNEGYPKAREDFTITKKVPTMAFSWLKAAKRALTPR